MAGYTATAKTIEWGTPPEVFDPLNEEFHFTLDVCATPGREKVARYFSPEQDGLPQVWQGVCWMNPPYGREIAKWVQKAYESRAVVVALLPVRSDTKWWHDYVLGKAEVRFMRGRVKFINAEGKRESAAPFPTAIVIWR